MKWRAGIAPLIAALLSSSCGPEQPTPYAITTGDGQLWDLVWSDEFDYRGLPDPDRWGYEVGYIRNDEKQYYTEAREENAYVQDGVLTITARKETLEGYEYTSASLNTKGTAAWTYGRFEIRAKLPSGLGMWPAIWMLGANIDEVGWPECGEIDIMENVGFEPIMIHGTVHTGAYNHVLGTAKGSRIPIQTISDDFHVYAIEWFEDHIDFYVDETRYFTFDNDGTGVAAWPFDLPHYLIINAAVGGSWGGQQGIDDDIFPQAYQIDYVRVYEARK